MLYLFMLDTLNDLLVDNTWMGLDVLAAGVIGFLIGVAVCCWLHGPSGGTGRRTRLKIWSYQKRGGSSPPSGT